VLDFRLWVHRVTEHAVDMNYGTGSGNTLASAKVWNISV